VRSRLVDAAAGLCWARRTPAAAAGRTHCAPAAAVIPSLPLYLFVVASAQGKSVKIQTFRASMLMKVKGGREGSDWTAHSHRGWSMIPSVDRQIHALFGFTG
jgi:hypothetical protein